MSRKRGRLIINDHHHVEATQGEARDLWVRFTVETKVWVHEISLGSLTTA
jgi:hypothetical protein